MTEDHPRGFAHPGRVGCRPASPLQPGDAEGEHRTSQGRGPGLPPGAFRIGRSGVREIEEIPVAGKPCHGVRLAATPTGGGTGLPADQRFAVVTEQGGRGIGASTTTPWSSITRGLPRGRQQPCCARWDPRTGAPAPGRGPQRRAIGKVRPARRLLGSACGLRHDRKTPGWTASRRSGVVTHRRRRRPSLAHPPCWCDLSQGGRDLPYPDGGRERICDG